MWTNHPLTYLPLTIVIYWSVSICINMLNICRLETFVTLNYYDYLAYVKKMDEAKIGEWPLSMGRVDWYFLVITKCVFLFWNENNNKGYHRFVKSQNYSLLNLCTDFPKTNINFSLF